MQGAFVANQDGQDTVHYAQGEFFGERALLTHEVNPFVLFFALGIPRKLKEGRSDF